MRSKRNIVLLVLGLVMTVAICAVWFPIVTSGNYRADSERMIHEPEVALAQYSGEGRTGLVFLLKLFGLDTWHPMRSGVLFLLFFLSSSWIIFYGIYYFSGRKFSIPYMLFIPLLTTCPIWAFQLYFILQIAGIGFGMLLLSILAWVDVLVFLKKSPVIVKCLCALCTTAVLCFAITIYQALAVYYAAIVFVFLLCRFQNGMVLRIRSIALWIMSVLLAPVLYLVWQHMMHESMNPYLMQQIKWNSLPFLTCIAKIILEATKTLFIFRSAHVSFYPFALAMVAIEIIQDVRLGRAKEKSVRWEWAAAVALLLLPFLMSVFYGDCPVPRTQFASQVVGAFIPVWFILRTKNRRSARIAACLCIVAIVTQVVLVCRLNNTDNVRNKRDVVIAENILASLEEADTDGKPLVVLGALPFEADSVLMEKIDVYGMSFFEWAYEEDEPGSNTPAAVRLFRAMRDKDYRAYADADQLEASLEIADEMPCYPDSGYIRKLDDCVVIKLSDQPVS